MPNEGNPKKTGEALHRRWQAHDARRPAAIAYGRPICGTEGDARNCRVDGGRRATKGNTGHKICHAKDGSDPTVLGLIWIGYTVWPLYDLFVLVRAIETRDVGTVLRHVNFGAVRVSLTEQVLAAYVRRTGSQLNPLAQRMAVSAVGIADQS